MISAVLFDMYRTLGEDKAHHLHFIDTLLEFDLTPDDAKYVMDIATTDAFDGTEHYEHSEDRDAYNAWCRTHLVQAIQKVGASADVAQEIADRHDEWQLEFVARMEPYDEAHDVLAQLKQLGLEIVVCSNWNWDADQVIADMGLTDVVDAVSSSARLGVRKPHAAFFERIMQERSLGPRDALFVGDTWPTDITGATAVGMQAVWVDRWSRILPEKRDDVIRVDDLHGVSALVASIRA
jgi:HAD superfamily hydrolase (TIGR01509 family)